MSNWPYVYQVIPGTGTETDIMHTGIVSTIHTLVGIAAVLVAPMVHVDAAAADPGQDEQFLALLDQQGIPALDGIPRLVARAHRVCAELDDGTPADAVIDELSNATYEDNPALHLMPGRVSRTSAKFVTAAVGAYCPANQGKLP